MEQPSHTLPVLHALRTCQSSPFPSRCPFSSQNKSTPTCVSFAGKAKKHREPRGGRSSPNRCGCRARSHSLPGAFCSRAVLSKDGSPGCHLVCVPGGVTEEPIMK